MNSLKSWPNSASDFRLDLLREVAKDLRYLLDRGYHLEPALRFLANRWALNALEREILKRAVFPSKEARKRKKKIVSLERVRGKTLFIDGHNVLITVESGLLGHPVFLADDGLVRDARRLSRRFRPSATSSQALEAMFQVLEKSSPQEIVFFLDRPLSRSGELAALIREGLRERGLKGRVELIEAADQKLKEGVPLLASADAPLVDRAELVFDLAAKTLRSLKIEVFSLGED